MTDRSSDEDLARLVGELVQSLRDLERELGPPDPREGPPLPTPRDLRRFTSEIAIPGMILVLETNVRALRLLQRALELGDDAERATGRVDDLRDRATVASATTLDRLDETLVELGDALQGRPDNETAAELLEEARALRSEVRSRLVEAAESDQSRQRADDEATDGRATDDTATVDVEAELASLREELEGTHESDGAGSEPPEPGGDPSDGTGDGTDASADSPDDDDRSPDAT